MEAIKKSRIKMKAEKYERKVEKYKKALINWGIAFVMFFLIPVFINVVMGLFSSFKIILKASLLFTL